MYFFNSTLAKCVPGDFNNGLLHVAHTFSSKLDKISANSIMFPHVTTCLKELIKFSIMSYNNCSWQHLVTCIVFRNMRAES